MRPALDLPVSDGLRLKPDVVLITVLGGAQAFLSPRYGISNLSKNEFGRACESQIRLQCPGFRTFTGSDSDAGSDPFNKIP
jgi:hypothetical protein